MLKTAKLTRERSLKHGVCSVLTEDKRLNMLSSGNFCNDDVVAIFMVQIK